MNIKYKKKGQVLILIVILFVVLCGFIGLALDGWQIVYQKQKMQDALDISLLSGARELIKNPDNAIQVTKQVGEKNGLNKSNINVKTNYQGDKNKINADVSKDIKLWFMPVLGIKTVTVKAVSTAAVMYSTVSDPIFDYVFFSGSATQGVKSSFANTAFNGKVHGNSSFETSGGNNEFDYDLEVVGKINLKSNTIYHGKIINPASVIPVPIYDINKYKNNAVTTYNTDVTFSGGNLILNGIMFVNGNISINNGCKVQGTGTIVATGSITITGGGKLFYNSSGDLIALYAQKDITITGGNDTYYGVLYAPSGEITLTGGNDTFYGSVIGNTIRISNGGYTFNYDPKAKEPFGEKKIQVRLIE